MRKSIGRVAAIVVAMVCVVWMGLATYGADAELAAAARKGMDGRFRGNDVQLEKLFGGYHKVRTHVVIDAAKGEELKGLEDVFLEAYERGEMGEARRAIHHAYAVMNGETFGARETFLASLMLYADRAVVDPSEGLKVELRQLFKAKGPEARAGMRVEVLLKRAGAVRGNAEKDFGEVSFTDGAAAGRWVLDVDLEGVKDGSYLLLADVYGGDQPLRRITRAVTVVAGFGEAEREFSERLVELEFTERVDRIEGYVPAKATILYPFSFAKRLDRNELDAKQFNFAKAVVEGRALLESLESGAGDVRQGGTGDQVRHHVLAGAEGRIMPYRLIVPTGYDAAKATRLIVTLHGGSGGEATHIGAPGNQIHQLAEQYNTIVLSPLGYNNYGGWGRPTSDPARQRDGKLSEADALGAIELVKAEYNIDEGQVFLMGHSMGGKGTWSLVAKYPEMWAAVAPISSGQCTPEGFGEGVVGAFDAPVKYAKDLSPYPFERLRGTPVLITHGARDPRADVANARAMYAAMKAKGLEVEYLENAEGTHAMLQYSLGPIFEFFDKVGKR